jgi:hypothetical protein
MTISGTITANNIIGSISVKNVTGELNIPQVSGSITYSPTIVVNPYGPEATGLFNRMAIQPPTTLKQLIDKTINDLKTAGIWQLTDKLHKWDLHSEQASLLDWKDSGHDATNVNGASFTPKYGVSTTRYVNYLNLNFIPSIDCNQASLNDIGYSLDDLTMEETLGMNFGAQSSGSSIALTFRTVEIGALRPWALVNGSTWKVWNGAAGQFLYYVQRNNSANIQIYKDSNTVTSGNSASEAMINQSLLLGGYLASSGIPVTHNISTSTLWLGKSFTAEQRASWYDIINYWKANISSTF